MIFQQHPPKLSRNSREVRGNFRRLLPIRFAGATPDDPPTILADFALVDDSGAEELVTCKGPAFDGELTEGLDYLLFGCWKKYTNKRTGESEDQFVFTSFIQAQPASREAVIAYLSNAGEGHGLGRSRASRLWQEYGADAVRVLRESPEEAAETLSKNGLKLKAEQARAISAELTAKVAIENCLLDLQTLLAKRGFPRRIDRTCIAKWGVKAAQKIRRNPFLLLQFKGCGFARCDSLWRDLGLPAESIVRQGVAAWNAVARDSSGHIWYPREIAEHGAIMAAGRDKANTAKAIRFAKLAGGLREITTDASGVVLGPSEKSWVAHRPHAEHESQIAERIAGADGERNAWPDARQIDGISDHQREQLAKAMAGPIGILGGGPGTGKTYTVAALVRYLLSAGYGDGAIIVGAPTGKAAVRVTENLARYGIDLRARTWHSHLASLDQFDRPEFSAKVIIGDESSMIDNDLMAAVMRARPAGTHLLLVGDVHQLPPVGPGAPLRDLIFAGLPYGELTEIKRNSGGIVEACQAIREGRRFALGDNLTLAECSTPERQIAGVLHAIHCAQAKGLDPIWDAQPLAAVNEKSPLARTKLNEILQAELNPSPVVSGSPFRLRDKIVCLKNGKYKPAGKDDCEEAEYQDEQSGELYVANGELAEIVDIDSTSFVARLNAPRREIRVYRGKEEQPSGDAESGEGEGSSSANWDLGYCLSVHKSQGSEWPVVIPVLDAYPGAKRVCSREWIYTAISRAKDHCRLVGDIGTAHAMCRRVSLRDRKTFLAEKIKLMRAENLLAGW